MKAQFVAMALTGGVHLVAPKYLKVALLAPLVLMSATCAWKKTSLKVAGNAMLFLSLPQMFFGYYYSKNVWNDETKALYEKYRQATTLDDALFDELRALVETNPFLLDHPKHSKHYFGAHYALMYLKKVQLNDENRRFFIDCLSCFQGGLNAQKKTSSPNIVEQIDQLISRNAFLIMRLGENKDENAWVQMLSEIAPNERIGYLECVLSNQPLSHETKIKLSNQEFSDLLDLHSAARNSFTQSDGDQYAMRILTDLFRLVASHVGLEYALEKLNQIPKEKRQFKIFVSEKTDVYWVWWMAAHDATKMAGIESVDQLEPPEDVDLPDTAPCELIPMIAAQKRANETKFSPVLQEFLQKKGLLLSLPERD
ncbi:MAG: hypothetical protein H7A38_07295 [Chlamydiales bacterium]|nr:hypothetical protein [Chlamydiales bacterium]